MAPSLPLVGTEARPTKPGLLAFLARANAEPTGVGGAAVVVVASAILSVVGWIPLSFPARVLDGLVPAGNCVGSDPGSAFMYLCSAKVATLKIAGPIAIIALLIVLRSRVVPLVLRGAQRVPAEARPLVAPLLATAVFVMSWGDIHAATGSETGIMPQTIFPAVVGLFTYAVTRWNAAMQRALRPLFDQRDRLSRRWRYLAAIGIPLLVSLIITNEQRVSQTALKEQVVVIIGLLTGYLALAPRGGDLLAGARELASFRRRPA